MRISTFLFSLVSGILLFSSCSEDINDITASDTRIPLTFGIDSPDGSTRAYKENRDFVWDKGDQVTIFAQGHVDGDPFSFERYSTTQQDLRHQGRFSGTTWKIDDTKYYWALYPAQSDSKLVGNTSSAYVECTIPTTQKAKNDTFDPAACVQVGTASPQAGQIEMHNVCAFFYVTVGKGCSGIRIESSNSDWNLSGKVQVEANSSGASIKQFTGDNKNYVELTDIPSEGGTFYLAFVPSTHNTPSFTVSFTGVYSADIIFNSKSTFSAGHTYYLGDFTEQYNKLQPEPNEPEDGTNSNS